MWTQVEGGERDGESGENDLWTPVLGHFFERRRPFYRVPSAGLKMSRRPDLGSNRGEQSNAPDFRSSCVCVHKRKKAEL